MRYKVVSIVGARPQFIKLAPIYKEFLKYNDVKHIVLHTGQHYDFLMSDVFFQSFNLPKPDINLNIGSGSHHSQTGEMIKKVGEAIERIKPDMVIIYGDTNTTLAGAIAAVKLKVPIAHIESGLRSFIKYMPEEINRVVADRLSDLLFVPSRNAIINLGKEGILNLIANSEGFKKGSPPYIIECGDLMYDILKIVLNMVKEDERDILERYNLRRKGFALATIHRAENTDNEKNLIGIMNALNEISKELTVVLPLHPRTRGILQKSGGLRKFRNINIIDPLSYNEMLILEKNSRVIFTDSGGVQKEAFWLKIPCITMRDRTEWIETVEAGFNVLTGADRNGIINAFKKIERRFEPNLDKINVYGSGDASVKIVKFIRDYLRWR